MNQQRLKRASTSFIEDLGSDLSEISEGDVKYERNQTTYSILHGLSAITREESFSGQLTRKLTNSDIVEPIQFGADHDDLPSAESENVLIKYA